MIGDWTLASVSNILAEGSIGLYLIQAVAASPGVLSKHNLTEYSNYNASLIHIIIQSLASFLQLLLMLANSLLCVF